MVLVKSAWYENCKIYRAGFTKPVGILNTRTGDFLVLYLAILVILVIDRSAENYVDNVDQN